MTAPTTSVSLLDSELLLLDGACTAKVQAQVDLAKSRVAAAGQYPQVSPAGVKVIVAAVAEANASGALTWESSPLSNCPVCNKSGGYVPFKSGPRKGQDNRSKPRRLRGVELKRSLVRIEGHVSIGACADCMAELLPHLRAALATVPAQLPDLLISEGSFAWIKDQHRRCIPCGWVGGESKLGKLPAMFGGHYPGKCPECGAEQKALGPKNIETLDTFDLIPAAEEAP